MELQSRIEELQADGIGLVGISYDSQQTLADFSERNGITFPLLSDVGSVVIRDYGILNTVAEQGLGGNTDPAAVAAYQMYVTVTQENDRFKGIAFPGTFNVDPQGRVTSRFFEDYYWERNTVSNVMARVGVAGTPVEATRVSTAHLDLTAYVTDAVASLGTRFSVVLDIAPKAGMHLYAPGASGYRVVTLRLDPLPFVRVEPPAYPASEIYYFEPLDERVPVFQEPFTLRTEMIVEATAEARPVFAERNELAITGTLDYQACDDEICYNPESVPLSWTVALEQVVPRGPRP